MLDRRAERVRLGGEIRGDELLLAVLSTADVVQVDVAGPDLISEADRRHVELVPAPPRAVCENGDVPPVGIDVQVVRVQVAYANPHAAASQ